MLELVLPSFILNKGIKTINKQSEVPIWTKKKLIKIESNFMTLIEKETMWIIQTH